MIDFAGRKVLVTGGSRGIGAACCRAFARAGAAVVVHYARRREAAQALLAEVEALSTAPHALCGADFGDPDAPNRLFDFVSEHWGGLDCLVNNAGIWARNPIAELDAAAMEETWRINVSAVFDCTRRAVPLLAAAEDGNVVNLTSTAGQRGEAFHSPYAASKGALIAATKSWATELAPQVRVNSVAPGWVDTEMSAGPLEGPERERIEAEIPLRRVATADDIAAPVVFLASPAARHITGEILNVNGGSVLAG